MYCVHSWFFSPPVQEAGSFCLAPGHFPGMDGHDKTQVTREPTTVALHSCPRAPLMPDACCSPNSQSPYFRFLGRRRATGAPPAESLTCSAAWRRPVAHLHRILEHPFFSATAASALTSPGGGAHTATWWPRGKEGRVGRPWKWGGSGREAPLWPPFWAVCLMWAAGLDLHELWETNSTRREDPNDSRLHAGNRISKELALRGLVMKGNDLVFYFSVFIKCNGELNKSILCKSKWQLKYGVHIHTLHRGSMFQIVYQKH